MTKSRRAALHLQLRLHLHLHTAKPLATAYLLALLSSTAPSASRLLLLLARRKLSLDAAWAQLLSVFRNALFPHRFPFFCASLIGGSTLLRFPIRALLLHPFSPFDARAAGLFANFISALLAASLSFKLLNSRPAASTASPLHTPTHLQFLKPGPFDDPPETNPQEIHHVVLATRSLSPAQLAGRTMDLTLFTAIRALDVLISTSLDQLPKSHQSKPSMFTRISKAASPLLFCFSAATIMHAWFYSPSRLPYSYNTWISSAAQLDHRLLLALRHARYGTWVYGKDTGMRDLLGSMCHDLGLPEDAGDPARTIPVPCEIVHMGCGDSCEKHALFRFWRGWCFAAKIHAPIQAFVLARHVKTNGLARLTRPVLLKALVDMSRSSAFLGAFISFFYYGVCLSRTRLGPKLFSYKTITPQMWDSGLCVLGGCLLCGTSIFVEQAQKQAEILLFVLPRAVATWFPRRYLPENRWKEHVTFALSAAVLLTVAQERPDCIRGIFGRLLSSLVRME